MPRILLVTPMWPTSDLPHAGVFVRDRVGTEPGFRIVHPRNFHSSKLARYARLFWDAMTARGSFGGVEAHELFPAGLIGLIAARIRGIPLVVYAHNFYDRNPVNRHWLFEWLGRLVFSHAEAVVTNSKVTAGAMRRLGEREVVVNPPGIDLQRFHPSPRPSARRVLFVGGDRPEKGTEIARRLADTLVGRHIREVDPAEMPGLMADHDVLLMPSSEEGFGVAAAEAIASGRWVVAGAAGGLAEVVTDGVNGTIVRDGDYAKALSEVPDYDPWAVAATADRFDVSRHRRAMRDLWSSLLGGGPTGD